MTYINCPSCGQKALTVATRCPRCGAAFESRLSRHPETVSTRPRLSLSPLIIVALAVILGVVAVRHKRAVPSPTPPPTSPVDSASSPRHRPAGAPAVAADSTRAALPPSPPQSESPPPASNRARVSEPTPFTGPPVSDRTARRYARTWVNIRARPSSTAPVIRVLRPRQVVLVGSLEQGWYRVMDDREASGFVDGRYLDATPSAVLP